MIRKEKRVVREIISKAQKLDKYDIGETIEGLASKIGKKPSEILKLNSNENLFISRDFLRSLLKQVAEEADPRIYPRDEFMELKESISAYHNIPVDEIVIGAGSDQLIDLVSRMSLGEGDEALSIAPTFVIYERCVKLQGATYKSIPLKDDFSLNLESLLSSITSKTKIIFLCSPNNPTANQFKREDILRLAEEFDGIVAVDEAYADFAGSTLVNRAGELENLIVFRTFSKVFGLAGLRLGYAVTNKTLAKTINERFQMPYSVSLVALKIATKMLENLDYVRGVIEEIKAERTRMIRALNQISGVRAFPSETNFVLFQVNRDSSSVYRDLLSRGVIVRNIGRVLKFNNCLRVTVAPAPLANRFLRELREVLNAES
ncbi:MAG TPA: histidinol-phosphate transaminase [Candidatus Bathyarchaeota archaeon]|nr:histidinol-phosphate transaminase [Candidatus Bathyarchaeota archaeon]